MRYLKLTLLLVAAVVAFAITWLAIEGVVVTRPMALSNITHEIGHAYRMPVRGAWPLEHSADSTQAPNRSTVKLFENQRALGPAHAMHDAVRTIGQGRYSDWSDGSLRFSSSDNSDPRTNGHTYSLRLALFAPVWLLALSWLMLVVAILLNPPVWRLPWGALRFATRIPGVKWSVQNLLPGLVVSVVLVVLMAGVGEIFMRIRTPFITNTWPSIFDNRLGFIFKPDSTVHWTNHVDYWTINHANSLGFLDREPPKSKYPAAGVCRIAIIGDSFVEAAQVPLDEKVQVQLERLGSQNGQGLKYQTIAFGFSGTGQANQLPFYDVFARLFHPDVVVLVFVDNDFANNSSVLESIRNGWDPMHPPRVFFQRTADGAITTIPIDPHWNDHLFPAEPTVQDWHTSAHQFLMANSFLYNWIFERISLGYPHLAEWLDGSPSWKQQYADREREVKRRWPHRFDLSGWNFPNDWDMDNMFYANHLAPVFKEALAFTGHALDEFAERGGRDGFHLIILADKGLYKDGSLPQEPKYANPLLRDGAIDRLKDLARSRNIPIVDLRSYIISIKKNPANASYPHDGHWSPQGHLWAAQALNKYIRSHPEVCERSRKTN